MAWQSITVGVACPLVLAVLLALGDVFRPERTTWLLACIVSFVAFGLLALVQRRVGRLALWAQLVEALVMMVVIGTSTDELGVLAACFVTVALVVVNAATYLGGTELVLVAAGCSISVALLLAGQGTTGATLALTTTTVTVLGVVPGLVLFFGFRRQLERDVLDADRVAQHDHLTGLLNRYGLAVASRGLVARAAAGGHLVGVLLMDVDRFKAVNDVHGHLAGDEVLRVLARAVLEVARDGDVVARIGGEEFCVLLVCGGSDDLAAAGERLRATVAAAPTDPPVTVSVGGACLTPARDDDGEDFVMRLLARADEPLYEVKWAGRNGVDVVVGP